MYVYVRQERAQVCKYVDLCTVSMKLLERAKKSVEIDTAVNSLASGWFRGFPEKKNLNALDFAWEFLWSGMLYRPGKNLKRRIKSFILH